MSDSKDNEPCPLLGFPHVDADLLKCWKGGHHMDPTEKLIHALDLHQQLVESHNCVLQEIRDAIVEIRADVKHLHPLVAKHEEALFGRENNKSSVLTRLALLESDTRRIFFMFSGATAVISAVIAVAGEAILQKVFGGA